MYSSSDFDYVWRKNLKGLLSGSAGKNGSAAHPDYAIPNEWMLKNRQFHFKSYNLWKYEPMIEEPNYKKIDAMTYGFEFRLLRKIRILPESFLFSLELFLEKLFRAVHIPYFSYSGWVYTGIYKRVA